MNDTQMNEYLNEFSIPCSYVELLFDANHQPYDGRILNVNAAFETLFSTTASAIKNHTLMETKPVIESTIRKWLLECADAAKNHVVYDEILYSILPNVWVVATAVPFSKDRIVIFLSEVKEHSLSRIHIEEFFSANLELMCITNTKGDLLKVNNEFENLLGYDISELEGTNIMSYIDSHDLEHTRQLLKNLGSLQELNQFVTQVRCKDGTFKNISWKSQPHGDYIFTTGRDITDIAKMHEDIKRKNEQLTKLAAKLKEANSKLTTLAHRDQVTGLFNRTYFDAKVMFEMQDADRDSRPLSMFIFDVDYFKTVNDTYGHPVGDEILGLLSSILLQHARPTDSAFRIGGEEFALLMPNTDANAAKILAEQIRISFEGHTHPLVGIITASFGVAERRINESFSSWYRRVDNALYAAKNQGRNVVVCDMGKPLPILSSNIDWQPAWNSGNVKIDNEHKELLRLALEINDSYYANEAKDCLDLLIEQLLFHIEKHFQDEESILKKIGYQELEEHAILHTQLLQKANLLKKDYLSGTIKPSAFFVFILDEVVVAHLEKEDVKFFPLFASTQEGQESD